MIIYNSTLVTNIPSVFSLLAMHLEMCNFRKLEYQETSIIDQIFINLKGFIQVSKHHLF